MYQESIPQPRDERESTYSGRPAGSEYGEGYKGPSQSTDQLADAVAQRLRYEFRGGMRPGMAASSGQRLALAIVSIVMLVPLTAIILGTSAFAGWITPLVLILVFTAIVIINLAFNYRN